MTLQPVQRFPVACWTSMAKTSRAAALLWVQEAPTRLESQPVIPQKAIIVGHAPFFGPMGTARAQCFLQLKVLLDCTEALCVEVEAPEKALRAVELQVPIEPLDQFRLELLCVRDATDLRERSKKLRAFRFGQ